MDKREYSKDVYGVILDNRRGKTRHPCPSCKQNKCFTRYIYTETGEDVGDEFGRCDHARKCGYDKRPVFSDLKKGAKSIISSREVHKSINMFDDDIMDCIPTMDVLDSMKNMEVDPLFSFLSTLYGGDLVRKIFLRYYIGIGIPWHRKWKGIIYWQIDRDLMVRTGKMMGYEVIKKDGKDVDIKRVKEPIPRFSWIHNNYTDFCFKQCLFGEHLLRGLKPRSVVNVVESEKTAIICSLRSPDKIFVATGGLDLLNSNKLNPFHEMKLIFHPDKGDAYNKWSNKIKSECSQFDTEVSDYMEKNKYAPDGSDVGDVEIARKIKQLYNINLFEK